MYTCIKKHIISQPNELVSTCGLRTWKNYQTRILFCFIINIPIYNFNHPLTFVFVFFLSCLLHFLTFLFNFSFSRVEFVFLFSFHIFFLFPLIFTLSFYIPSHFFFYSCFSQRLCFISLSRLFSLLILIFVYHHSYPSSNLLISREQNMEKEIMLKMI